MERLIQIFTDENDVVIDPCAGSGVTLLAAKNLNRRAYGFEIKKNFFKDATKWVTENALMNDEIKRLGFAKTKIATQHSILF